MLQSKDRVADWIKKKRAYNMLPVETHRRADGTQIENEGIEKDISCKQKRQENGNSNNNIQQHRL